MTRQIPTESLIPVIATLCQKACCHLRPNLIAALQEARECEASPYGREALDIFLQNANVAAAEEMPACQDTGMTIVWMEIGQEVSWTGAPLEESINAGVRKGYVEGYLRKSVFPDPLRRHNSGDNTPCMIHTQLVSGDGVRITVMPKGGGSENVGAFRMLTPAEGIDGVKKFVLETVEKAGGKPCPPVIVGVGIGGTMDMTAWLAKKALFRPIGEPHPDPFYAALEKELLEKINRLGIGPLGMGGRVTALDVHLEYAACHLTSLPVAVNFQCHSARQASAEI